MVQLVFNLKPERLLKHPHIVEMRFYCPQTFLYLDFQCRDDVSELNQAFSGLKRALAQELSQWGSSTMVQHEFDLNLKPKRFLLLAQGPSQVNNSTTSV